MLASTRTVGLVLIVVGILLAALAAVWLVSGVAEESLRRSGLMLGLAVTGVLVLPLLGGGVILLLRGRRELGHLTDISKQKRLLNMIQTQGHISVAEAAIELDVDRDTLKSYLYDLVGKKLFSGYVNWDQGMLYSAAAASMSAGSCPNCGAKLEMAGKGVILCPYCGTETFT